MFELFLLGSTLPDKYKHGFDTGVRKVPAFHHTSLNRHRRCKLRRLECILFAIIVSELDADTSDLEHYVMKSNPGRIFVDAHE